MQQHFKKKKCNTCNSIYFEEAPTPTLPLIRSNVKKITTINQTITIENTKQAKKYKHKTPKLASLYNTEQKRQHNPTDLDEKKNKQNQHAHDNNKSNHYKNE